VIKTVSLNRLPEHGSHTAQTAGIWRGISRDSCGAEGSDKRNTMCYKLRTGGQ